MKHLIYRGHVYRLAADAGETEAPTVDKSVNPAQHYDAIMRTVREQLGIPGPENIGAIKRTDPPFTTSRFGDMKLGYEIHAGIVTKLETSPGVFVEKVKIDPGVHGTPSNLDPPYMWVAQIGVKDTGKKDLEETVEHVEIVPSDATITGAAYKD